MWRPAHGATTRPGPSRPAGGYGRAPGRPGPRREATDATEQLPALDAATYLELAEVPDRVELEVRDAEVPARSSG
jgi:hypothetical protein